MAIADMFLKLPGVTGEAVDADHADEIQVKSWSWGMKGPTRAMSGGNAGPPAVEELLVVKLVDQSSPTLMGFLWRNKLVPDATLTVRKAGETPLEYYRVDLKNVRVTSIQTESEGAELVDRVNLGFDEVRVSYTPQDETGAKGGGANVFEAKLGDRM